MWTTIQSILEWLFIALLILSLIIFIGFYLRGAFRDRLKYRVKNPPYPNDPQFPLILASITNSFITQGIIRDFWNEPGAIQKARLDAISKAQYTIDFETFFMTPGQRADNFAVAIAQKALEGVEVRLIVDSYGTKDISKQYWERLKRSGVKILFFNSYNWKAPLDYAGRTHRKLLLIDNKFGLVGGAGISDLWDGTQKDDDSQPWLDVEMSLEGEIIAILERVFSQHWTFGNCTADLSRQKPQIIGNKNKQQNLMLVIPGANPRIRFSPIRAFKYNSIISARKSIWLASPYFLPDDNSINLLIAAKQNGLDVRILTTSERSDKKLVYCNPSEQNQPFSYGLFK